MRSTETTYPDPEEPAEWRGGIIGVLAEGICAYLKARGELPAGAALTGSPLPIPHGVVTTFDGEGPREG